MDKMVLGFGNLCGTSPSSELEKSKIKFENYARTGNHEP